MNGLRHMFTLNLVVGGPCQELEDLMPSMFEKVIPRLLRPLESGGNSIVPSLVHGDLWYGNAAVIVAEDAPLIFDPSSFWAHNECKSSELSIFSRSIMLIAGLKMSWETGVPIAICSPKVISMLIIIIYPSLLQKKIMMIVMLFMLCKETKARASLLVRLTLLPIPGDSIFTLQHSFPRYRLFGKCKFSKYIHYAS